MKSCAWQVSNNRACALFAPIMAIAEFPQKVSMHRIAILTPAPGYYEDWSWPKAAFDRLFGSSLTYCPWTDPGNLDDFDLILPILAWGYQRDCPAWFALLDRLEHLPVANPAAVLRWNSDKAYLLALANAGVATVPTLLPQALTESAVDAARQSFSTDQLVIKPAISGGADGTYLIGPSDPLPAAANGQRMLIQPFLPAIASEGEFSLFYFDRQFSHAISKHPAAGDFRVQEQFGGEERAVEAPDDAKALAIAALEAAQALNDNYPILYARVDMVRDARGAFRLMEIELIEPSLFLHFAPDSGALFAASVGAHLARLAGA